jgi:hypothetical protein
VSGSPAADVVEQGRPRRPPHPHRTARLVVLGVVLVLVAVAGAVLDHRARVGEGAAVRGCARAATSSVRYTDARVDGIAGYVQPALRSGVGAPLRRRLLGSVSAAVRPTVPQLRRARDRCVRTRVVRLHGALDARRRDCLLLLERDLAFVTGVTRDGALAYRGRSLPAGRCTAPST